MGFEGNHEHRIKKYLSHNPRLKGQKYGVSFKHLNTNKWFNEYHEYAHGGPAIGTYNGVDFAHYFCTANSPNPIGGMHHAYSLLRYRHRSSCCGHSHKRSLYFDDAVWDRGLVGLVAGCYKGLEEDWAGQSNNGWWKGVVILRNFENGMFEPEFVSMDRIKNEYT